MDGMVRGRKGAGALVGLAALLVGCSHVGPLAATDGGSDSDSDSDSESDSDYVVLEPGFEDALTSWNGCVDVFIYGWGSYGTEEAEEVELVFHSEGHALEMYESEMDSFSQTFPFPDAAGVLEVRLGLDMAGDECTDIGPGDGVVWRTYAPVEGWAVLELVATSDDWSEWDLPADANFGLSDVVLEPSDGLPGDPVALPYLLLEDVSVGWFPG